MKRVHTNKRTLQGKRTGQGGLGKVWRALPDRISYEGIGFSPDTLALLKKMGHALQQGGNQGTDEVIVDNVKDDMLEAGLDRRVPDGGVGGK